MDAALAIRPETAADRAAADALIEAAFGPGRLAKAAERLREGRSEGPAIALAAESASGLSGVVRLWPVRIGETAALFLGPIAVASGARRGGLGRALIHAACEAAAKQGWRLVVLVGDPDWFAPLGFSSTGTERLAMPGPVDPRRLLLRELAPGAAEGLSGEISPA